MNTSFGIEDIRFGFPELFMDLEDLANARNIEPAKLQRGLGLLEMSICDLDEDVITLSSKALLQIVKNNNLQPEEIGRIYVGTESSIDGSKPIASYLLGILTQYFVKQGKADDCLRNVDVVDMTFACIGAIDAMHNSLAWLHTEPSMKAIVLASDIANYDLASSGEYTQGAGAAAVLLSANPAIMTIDENVGVASACVHDFFKPLRLHSKQDFVFNENLDGQEEIISIHRETPVFDGPLSNQTYQDRISEALHNYEVKSGTTVDLDQYDSFIFHLPYAYHGRRIFDKIFLQDLDRKGKLESFYDSLPVLYPQKDELTPDEYKSAKRAWNKAIVKSPEYTSLVKDKIERSERLSSKTGNVYTASIFLALLSDLYYKAKDGIEIEKVLFFAYGSGSKSKVFSGQLTNGWEKKVQNWDIDDQLEARNRIDFDTYVGLRLQSLSSPVNQQSGGVSMSSSGITETNRYSRSYLLED